MTKMAPSRIEGTHPPVHLMAEGVRLLAGYVAHHQLRAPELREMEVLALALHDVGDALEEVDDLLVIQRQRGFVEGTAGSVFDLHSGVVSIRGWLVLAYSPAHARRHEAPG